MRIFLVAAVLVGIHALLPVAHGEDDGVTHSLAPPFRVPSASDGEAPRPAAPPLLQTSQDPFTIKARIALRQDLASITQDMQDALKGNFIERSRSGVSNDIYFKLNGQMRSALRMLPDEGVPGCQYQANDILKLAGDFAGTADQIERKGFIFEKQSRDKLQEIQGSLVTNTRKKLIAAYDHAIRNAEFELGRMQFARGQEDATRGRATLLLGYLREMKAYYQALDNPRPGVAAPTPPDFYKTRLDDREQNFFNRASP